MCLGLQWFFSSASVQPAWPASFPRALLSSPSPWAAGFPRLVWGVRALRFALYRARVYARIEQIRACTRARGYETGLYLEMVVSILQMRHCWRVELRVLFLCLCGAVPSSPLGRCACNQAWGSSAPAAPFFVGGFLSTDPSFADPIEAAWRFAGLFWPVVWRSGAVFLCSSLSESLGVASAVFVLWRPR